MTLIVSDACRCNTCEQEFHYADHAWKCPHRLLEEYDCRNCGKPMIEQVDPVVGVKTGHLWRCEGEGCMPPNMVISVG